MRNKKVLMIIASITLVLVIIVGSSYAYLRIEKKSGDQNISIANFGLVITKDMKAITLDNEVPKSDLDGLKNTPNTFVIKNEGDVTAKYRLSLVDGTVTSTMSNLDIRYQVKRTRSNGSETDEVKSLGADGVFDEGIIAKDEEISFELVIWINYDANPNGLTYSKILSLEGLQADTLDTSGANPPEMLPNMIPVYYEKKTETDGSWKVADITNRDEAHKWYDYTDFRWANAVTVKDTTKKRSDITGNNVVEPLYPYIKLDSGDIYLDGVDDFYNLGYANHDFQNHISIVIRFKANSLSTSANQNIIGNPENGGIFLNVLANKCLELGIHTGGSDYNFFSSEKPIIEKEKWYTIVATYDGSKVQIYAYQDKTLVTKEEKSLTGNIKISSAPFILGANPAPSGFPTDAFLNGTINSALVYTDVLTDEEITNYFTGDITTYPSDNLLIEAKEFENQDWHSKYTTNDDGSISFDGKDDFYYLGQEKYDFKNSISIAARFKVNSFPSDYGYIIGNAEGAGFMLQVLSNKKIAFAINTGENYHSLYSLKTIETESWYTVVGTYDGSKMQLYIYQDGKVLSKDELTLTGNIKSSLAPLMIGANPYLNGFPQDSFFDFTIGSVFVYTDVLIESEIENYFTNEITDYPKDNLLIGYDNFKEKSSREVYLNANPGTEISMDDITSMWVWIPRYKYTIFNGNNETANEQMIKVEFEKGIESTGTVSCHDNIQTDGNSTSSEVCTDATNGSIKNGVSTYTHPAFTFGDDELVGFWFAKFEISTDDTECLNSQSTNCNKKGMNILIKPNQISLRYQDHSTLFANFRNMEVYNNIHGFSQSKEATSYLDSNGNLSGEIPNDSNNYDIHMEKNMEWGALVYLTMSKYGKYGNSLYQGEYREPYKNNYRENVNDIYIYKTGYSGKIPNPTINKNGVLYNNLKIDVVGQGYVGAGASTTGTIYGVYDMAGGYQEYVMANSILSDGNLNLGKAGTWGGTNVPLDKYYDHYSATISGNGSTKIGISKGKLGDATKEITKEYSSTGAWYSDHSGISPGWFTRGGYACANDHHGMFLYASSGGNGVLQNMSSRPVLTISREFPWKE